MGRESKSTNNSLTLWIVLGLGLWVAHTTYKKHQKKSYSQNRQEQQTASLQKSKQEPSTSDLQKLLTASNGHSVVSNSFDQIKNLNLPTHFQMSFRSVQPDSPPTQKLKFSYNPKAKAISFKRLMFFLSQRNGHERAYILDRHDCKHFAHDLYEEALKEDIKAYFVTIEYKDYPVGHAVTGFATTDQGIVYVDFTPTATSDGFERTKRLIWLEKNRHYLDIPIKQMWMGFENNFSNFDDYHQKHRELASDADEFNNRVEHFQKLASAHRIELNQFNQRVSYLNKNQVKVSQEEVEQIESEKLRLNRQAAELNQASEELKEEQEDLNDDQEHIGLPTSKRVVKNFQLFPNY